MCPEQRPNRRSPRRDPLSVAPCCLSLILSLLQKFFPTTFLVLLLLLPAGRFLFHTLRGDQVGGEMPARQGDDRGKYAVAVADAPQRPGVLLLERDKEPFVGHLKKGSIAKDDTENYR